MDIYTVPVDHRAILRDCFLMHGDTTSSAPLQLRVVHSGGSGIAFLLNEGIPSGEVLHWTGDVVLNAGDRVQFYSGVSAAYLVLSGAELPILPE